MPWIVGAFVLYRWCSLWWPFVVAHGEFDVLQVLQSYGVHVMAVAAQTVLAVVVAVGALIGVVGCRRAGLSYCLTYYYGKTVITGAFACGSRID